MQEPSTRTRNIITATAIALAAVCSLLEILVNPWWTSPGIVLAVGAGVVAAPNKRGAAATWAVPAGMFMIGYAFARLLGGVLGYWR